MNERPVDQQYRAVAAEAHATEPGEVFKVRGRRWWDAGRGEDSLFNVAVFLDKLFIRACRAMNEEQPQAL